MITLPVTAQMYHSLVQQQIQGPDNTVCVTPMQVQNLISSNLCSSLVNNNFSSTDTTYQILATTANLCRHNLMNNQVPNYSIKNAVTLSCSKNKQAKINSPVKKEFFKKKLLNMTALSKPKTTKILAKVSNKNNNFKYAKKQNEGC